MDLHGPSSPSPASSRRCSRQAAGERGNGSTPAPPGGPSVDRLARKLGLKIGDPAALTVLRVNLLTSIARRGQLLAKVVAAAAG